MLDGKQEKPLVVGHKFKSSKFGYVILVREYLITLVLRLTSVKFMLHRKLWKC